MRCQIRVIHHSYCKINKLLRVNRDIIGQQLLDLIRKSCNSFVERHYFGEIVLEKAFDAVLVDLATEVEVICVFFICAVFAKKSSMFAAVALSKNIGVVFAENLKVLLSLSNLGFDSIIDFDRHSLLSIK
jgi:hypothetical protein